MPGYCIACRRRLVWAVLLPPRENIEREKTGGGLEGGGEEEEEEEEEAEEVVSHKTDKQQACCMLLLLLLLLLPVLLRRHHPAPCPYLSKLSFQSLNTDGLSCALLTSSNAISVGYLKVRRRKKKEIVEGVRGASVECEW